jgi:hypothetical protein
VARLRTEVQVGKDQRVVHGQIHNSVVASECYGVMKTASKSVHSNRKVTVSSPPGASRASEPSPSPRT